MKHLFTLTLVASGLAWGQNAPQLNARELFYAPPPAPAANPATASTTASSAAAQTAANTAAKTAKATASNSSASNSSKKQTTAKSTAPSPTSTTPSAPASSSATTGPDTIVAQVGAPQVGAPQVGAPQATAPDGQTHVIATSATSGPLGLRYAVLKRDASGVYREVDPDTTFRTGDSIRLEVESNINGYLYVVTQGTSGQWQLLFPRPEVAGGSNRVQPHVKVNVPGDKGAWKFDEHAGTEKLFVVLARQPEPDLDKLIYAISGTGGGNGAREALLAQATIRDDVVSHLRDQMLARDLVFEKVDEDTTDAAPVKNENAAYVVNVSNAPDARVVKDFALQHR